MSTTASSTPTASSSMAVSDMALFADAMVALRDTVTSSQQSREHPFTVPPLDNSGGEGLSNGRGAGLSSNEINNAEGLGFGGLGAGVWVGGLGVGLGGVEVAVGVDTVGVDVGAESPPIGDDDVVERQLQALGEALEEVMEMLADSFVLRCSNPASTLAGNDAVLPVPILISLLRVAVSCKGNMHPQVN